MYQQAIEQRVNDLHDQYRHGGIDRREFLGRAFAPSAGGVSTLAMAQALLPRYHEGVAAAAWGRTVAHFEQHLA